MTRLIAIAIAKTAGKILFDLEPGVTEMLAIQAAMQARLQAQLDGKKQQTPEPDPSEQIELPDINSEYVRVFPNPSF